MTTSRRTALAGLFGAAAALNLGACGGGGSAAATSVASAPAPAFASTPAPAPAPGVAGAAPAASSAAASSPAACTAAANAKVGKTAALSTRAHSVSGQVKVVDSCTLEITNFNYDGGGLSKVLVYGGLAGNYVAGFPIGPNLKGTVYTGQTLRVTLNAGDIDKLDGISIWCTDANANFGEARFM